MCVTFSELLQLLMNWSVLYELCLYWTRKIRENGRLIKNMYIPLSKVPSNTQLSRTMYNMMSPVWLFQSLKLNYAASLMKTTSPQKCEKSTTCGSSDLKSRLQVATTRSSLTSSGRWKLLLGTMNMTEKVNISFFINCHKMIYKILNKIIVH